MKYKVTREKNPESVIKREIQSFDYALLYRFSECKLCKAETLTASDWNECMEARLFGRQREFHVFPQEGYGILVEDQEADGQSSDSEMAEILSGLEMEGMTSEMEGMTYNSEAAEMTPDSKSGQKWREAVRIERKYRLAHTDTWKTVVVYQYLEQDEDGQNRIVLTRLADLNQQEDDYGREE